MQKEVLSVRGGPFALAQGKGRRSSQKKKGLPENMNQKQFGTQTTVSFPPTMIGLPDRLKTTLVYVETISFSGSATPSGQVWNMNSCFDPNSSGTGHQPSFYDTFQSVYGRYFVEEFKIQVDVVNQTSTVGIKSVLAYGDQSIIGTVVDWISESKYAISKATAPSTGNCRTRMVLPWMSQRQLMGEPFLEADNAMYALVSASPTDIAWGLFKTAAIDGLTSITVEATFKIWQRVIFKDLLPQVPSLSKQVKTVTPPKPSAPRKVLKKKTVVVEEEEDEE